MLNDYVGQTVRIRAEFVRIKFGNTRLGTIELMDLRNIRNDENGDFLIASRSIPYDKHAKNCSVNPGDSIVFTADIKQGKSDSTPSITRARDFYVD